MLWAYKSTDPAADDAKTMSIEMHERMGSRSLNLLTGSVRLSRNHFGRLRASGHWPLSGDDPLSRMGLSGECGATHSSCSVPEAAPAFSIGTLASTRTLS